MKGGKNVSFEFSQFFFEKDWTFFFSWLALCICPYKAYVLSTSALLSIRSCPLSIHSYLLSIKIAFCLLAIPLCLHLPFANLRSPLSTWPSMVAPTHNRLLLLVTYPCQTRTCPIMCHVFDKGVLWFPRGRKMSSI